MGINQFYLKNGVFEYITGTELRTTVSTENIISTPRLKGSQANKAQGSPPAAATAASKTLSPISGKFRCPCGKCFASSWNFTQHAMVCKIAKAKKVEIPAPVKIKSDAASLAKSESSSPGKAAAALSPKNVKVIATPARKGINHQQGLH